MILLEGLSISVNAVIPTILVILVGYAVKISGLVKPDSFLDINKAVFSVFLPVSLFNSIISYGTFTESAFKALTFLGVFYLTVITASMFLIRNTVISRMQKGAIIQALFRSNFLIIAVSLIESIYGHEGIGKISGIVSVIVPLTNILAVIVLQYYADSRINLMRLFVSLLKNPFVIAALLGNCVLALHMEFPVMIQEAVSNIAKASNPLALFVLGGCLNPQSFGNNKRIIMTVIALKEILFPAAALPLAISSGFTGPELVAILIAIGGPLAVSSFSTAKMMNSDSELTAQLVFSTTLFSAVSLVGCLTVFSSVSVL